eukprot:GILI01006949.1.p1 GENE.GILI01006949.1~~GILI01006949.1.p1  ORF type:complete len:839 (+),score=188.28 GILI01006949.1:215-2518(+)
MHQAFMPLPVPLAFAIISGGVVWVLSSPSDSILKNNRVGSAFSAVDRKFFGGLPNWAREGIWAASAGTGVVLGTTFLHRVLLKVLLSYHGWLNDRRGKKSLKTIVWGLLLKHLYIRGGTGVPTQAYQTSLPHLPLPSLKETTERYMTSMEPLLDAEERKVVEDKLGLFLRKEGPKLQRFLTYKHLISANYISDWWLDIVYLRGRESILINSNFYGTSIHKPPPTTSQAARAAFMIHTMLTVCREVGEEKLPPLIVAGMVPMCMEQYDRAMCTRIPGKEIDRLLLLDYLSTRHIVVICKGKFFKVRLYAESGRRLTYLEIEATLQGIINDRSVAHPTEAKLPALTCWNRTSWAETRENCFIRSKINRTSLDTIEKALWVVCLDGDDSNVGWDDITAQGGLYMHGFNGCKRWMDKSLQMIVSPNGMIGMNGEHSWGDAPTCAHLWELCLARENRMAPYNPNGTIRLMEPLDKKRIQEVSTDLSAVPPEQLPTETPMVGPAKPQTSKYPSYPAERLPFVINTDLEIAVSSAAIAAQTQIDDLDLQSRCFNAFGKGGIKKAKCSPDGFIQMALQLAYYRNQSKFVQTYESASARFYLNGRTETIRSCTNESCAFVNAMLNEASTQEERGKLLRAACDKHSVNTNLAMTGKGVDRHLFALYVVSVGTNTDSPFLTQVMKRGWKLSTSQVPQTQSPSEWVNPQGKKETGDTMPRPSGGFGPVADDGYGVSYVISGENSFYFHVSSKRSCPATNSTALLEDIFRALKEMGALYA